MASGAGVKRCLFTRVCCHVRETEILARGRRRGSESTSASSWSSFSSLRWYPARAMSGADTTRDAPACACAGARCAVLTWRLCCYALCGTDTQAMLLRAVQY
eukprot:922647-Rhodomonas_salina.1